VVECCSVGKTIVPPRRRSNTPSPFDTYQHLPAPTRTYQDLPRGFLGWMRDWSLHLTRIISADGVA